MPDEAISRPRRRLLRAGKSIRPSQRHAYPNSHTIIAQRLRVIACLALALAMLFAIIVTGGGAFAQAVETPTDTATPLPSETSTPAASDTATPTFTPTDTASSTNTPEPEEVELTGNYIPDEVLVKFSPGLSESGRSAALSAVNADVVDSIPELGVLIIRIPEGQAGHVIAELRLRGDVEYAEPNYCASASDIIPNDPGWSQQYNMAAIHAPAAWSWTTGATWVTIAILDTGIDLTHPDLAAKILPGTDIVNKDSNPSDDHGHGTHVSAIAAASTNNGAGVAGVDWGANILPVKVLNAGGFGTYANIAAGITWATDHGAQVINMSFGGANPSTTLEDAVNYAFTHGVIQVAATGNDGVGSVYYPAAYAPVIAVAATDSSNSWAGFSNYGTGVTVAAPGVQIFSANLGGGYILRSGTSMAAPHVAGLAAILRGIPGNGPDRVRTIIQSTAADLGAPGWDPYFGYGLIQMDAAIQLAWPPATPTFTATSAGYWLWYPTLTRTPTRTLTPTTTLTLTPLVTSSITLTSTSTQTATESYESLATPTASSAQRIVSLPWWSICGGGAFIGAGGLLTWVAILLARSRRRRRW